MEIKKMKCKSCGYEWLPKVQKPKACPRCKVYIRYDKEEK